MFLPVRHDAPFKLAIIRTSSIGDVVLASACIDMLEKLNIEYRLVWISRLPASDLIAETLGPRGTVIDINQASTSEVMAHLAQVHFLVDLQVNLRSQMICRSFRRIYGRKTYTSHKNRFDRNRMVLAARLRGRSKPAAKNVLHPERLQHRLMSETLWNALSQELPQDSLDDFDVSTVTPMLSIAASNHQLPPSMREMRYGVWLAVAPGAAYTPKRAPSEVFTKILEKLYERLRAEYGETFPPVRVAFVGSSDDREVARQVIDSLFWPLPHLNLAGELSLTESAVALGQSCCLLSNDSALGHIAEAEGTSAAVLFGPTAEGFGFVPFQPGSSAFSTDIGCRPCSRHGATPCRYKDYRCFSEIDAEKVSDHLFGQVRGALIVMSQQSNQEGGKQSDHSVDAPIV